MLGKRGMETESEIWKHSAGIKILCDIIDLHSFDDKTLTSFEEKSSKNRPVIQYDSKQAEFRMAPSSINFLKYTRRRLCLDFGAVV